MRRSRLKNDGDEMAKLRRRAIMLQALDEQLHSKETPEVKQHYDCLRAAGHSEEDTREWMATILVFYIYHTKRGDAYTYADYVAELANLPKINWKNPA